MTVPTARSSLPHHNGGHVGDGPWADRVTDAGRNTLPGCPVEGGYARPPRCARRMPHPTRSVRAGVDKRGVSTPQLWRWRRGYAQRQAGCRDPPPRSLGQLKETIDVLSDPQALADIRKARHPMREVTSFAVWMLSVR